MLHYVVDYLTKVRKFQLITTSNLKLGKSVWCRIFVTGKRHPFDGCRLFNALGNVSVGVFWYEYVWLQAVFCRVERYVCHAAGFASPIAVYVERAQFCLFPKRLHNNARFAPEFRKYKLCFPFLRFSILPGFKKILNVAQSNDCCYKKNDKYPKIIAENSIHKNYGYYPGRYFYNPREHGAECFVVVSLQRYVF